jgi:membrane-associated protease RseP (regulator of RpoE activity)
MPRRWRRPVWGVVALAAGAFCAYAIVAPSDRDVPPIEIQGSIQRYVPGQEVPTNVASQLPREAYEAYSPPGAEIHLPPPDRLKDHERWKDQLTEKERSRLFKRGKKGTPSRELKYRYRVVQNWEIYRVPAIVRERFLDTREAMSVAGEAAGAPVQLPTGKEGFQITTITPGSLLEEAGLLPGDVILTVNGHPVRGPEDGRRLYAELKHEPRFHLVIQREGELLNLYYEVE